MQAAPSDDGFPAGWAWIERGSALIRRMNSERIAEDPRLRRLLEGKDDDATANVCEQEMEEKAAAVVAGMSVTSVPHAGPPQLATEMSFEELEAEAEAGASAASGNASAKKKQMENVASHASRMLLWTYRLQASLQNVLQYALFAQASEDGYFVPIAPRVYCVAPAYLTTFTRLFEAYTSPRQWNAAVRLLGQLDTTIAARFEDGACIFDCGLFDGVQRLHRQPLAFDELCDGRIASIAYRRGPVPSMHSAFIVASTVSAWLDLRPTNVAILMAPSNEQISVFATCCTLYCAEVRKFPSSFPFELLQVYQDHIRGAETWPMKLSRTFAPADAKRVHYTGSNVPQPQSRFVADFTALLELRDQKLVDFVRVTDVSERRRKLSGMTVAPAPRGIFINDVQLLLQPTDDGSEASSTSRSSSRSATTAAISYRPYIVLQNDKGVVFSSMVGGVHTVDLLAGPHVYHVAKELRNVTDLTLKMYHLPFGRPGEIILEARLHTALLLERLDEAETAEITLTAAGGDFDCVSSEHVLPDEFALQLRYGRDASAFPLAQHDQDDSTASALASPAAAAAAAAPAIANDCASHPDPIVPAQARRNRYQGPPIVSFVLAQPNVRTAFGDAMLHRIAVIRHISRDQLELFALFFVDVDDARTKVVTYQHLFRYLLPDPVRECLLDMGATEDALRECSPPPLEDGLSFDEEYARWLQHIYDADLVNAVGSFDGELDHTAAITDVLPDTIYRAVSLFVSSEVDAMRPPLPPPRVTHNHMTGRGAELSLIQQLPTYIFSTPKTREQRAVSVPDCLICRGSFAIGEEIKSLPCFHAYHAECVDAWLQLNKVCPVCLCAIDCMHGA